MKKYLLIILLAFWCLGAGRMWDYGETDLYDIGNLTWVDQIDSKSSAPSPIVCWNLDDGALVTDSCGTDTLNNTGVAAGDEWKQGDGSGDWEMSDSDDMTINDGSLSASFPGKSSTGNKTFTITFWIQCETTGTSDRFIFSKGRPANNDVSFYILQNESDESPATAIVLSIGYNSGADDEPVSHGSTLTCDDEAWYHVGVGYDNSDKSYIIHITDEGGTTVGVDKTGTMTLDANKMSNTIADFYIGQNGGSGSYYDGILDKIEIFTTKLTPAQIEARR